MSLRATRKILSVIFIIITALGVCLSVVSLTVRLTFCSENYVKIFFASDEITSQCKENFSNRIEALSAKSGIPARVFEAVENLDEVTSDSAIERLFGGHNTTLYTQETVEKFEELCIEYLDGNSIEYDETLIHNTAEEATQIYADCFGLDNTEQLTEFISSVEENYQNYLSIGLLLMLFPIIMLLIIYKKATDILMCVCSSFITSGLALALSGACSIIFKIGQNSLIYPQMYADAENSLIRSIFVILTVVGVVIGVLSVYAVISVYKKTKKD